MILGLLAACVSLMGVGEQWNVMGCGEWRKLGFSWASKAFTAKFAVVTQRGAKKTKHLSGIPV